MCIIISLTPNVWEKLYRWWWHKQWARLLQDSVKEKRREPKTESREHPHERDKEESKKKAEKGEVRDVGGNAEESVFMGSKERRFWGNFAKHKKQSPSHMGENWKDLSNRESLNSMGEFSAEWYV